MANVFKNLKITWKLLISSVIFLLPTLVLFFFFLSGIDGTIQFSRSELVGNRVQASLESVLTDLYSYEASVLRGSSPKSDSAERILAQWNQVIALEAVDGRTLRLEAYPGPRGAELLATWTALAKNPRPEGFTSLLADVQRLIAYVGNTSNLILDPDLDSYYTMDVTLLALPQTQNRIRNLRNLGLARLGNGPLGSRVQVEFAVYAAQLEESDLQRILSSSRTAFSEDGNFYGVNTSMKTVMVPGLDRYEAKIRNLITLTRGLGDPQSTPIPLTSFLEACDTAQEASLEYWTVARGVLDELLTTRVQSYERTRILGLSLTAFAIVLASLIMFLIVRGVGRAIDQTLSYADALAKGNLVTVNPVRQADEIGAIGKRLQGLQANLLDILRNEVRSTVQVISESLLQLSSSSQEISASSNQQAAAVKEIVSTMEDSDRLSRGIAEKINHVASLSEDTRDRVNNGFTIITSNRQAMESIKDANDQTIDEIRALSARVETIHNIVNIINGIAGQTKIIAFNAELEASSAGEAGRNFEIVATEIRRLADQSGASTDQIRAIIDEIQRATQSLVEQSRSGTFQITQGLELSAQLEALFQDILGSADLSAGSAGQIATLIQQQVQAFEAILLTLRQISVGIDSFVTSTRITRLSSEDLRKTAGELDAILGKFQLDPA